MEIQYKAVPGLLSTSKMQAKTKKCPAARSEAAINEEQLLSRLRIWITNGNLSNELPHVRSEKQKERLEKFKQGWIHAVTIIKYLIFFIYRQILNEDVHVYLNEL